MQQLFDTEQHLAAVECRNRAEQCNLPDEPQRRLEQHEYGLHGKQNHGQRQARHLPADRHEPTAVDCTVQEQSHIADERCQRRTRAAHPRDEQGVQTNVNNRGERRGQEGRDRLLFQQVHAFLEAGQAVEARADRQNRDERPADIVAGHGKHGHSQLGAHYAAGRDDEHNGRVCVADVREERDLLLLGVVVDHGYLPCINKDGRDKCDQCRHTVGNRVDGADCGILHGSEEHLIREADNIHENRIRHERQRVRQHSAPQVCVQTLELDVLPQTGDNEQANSGKCVRADDGEHIAEDVPTEHLQVEDVQHDGDERTENAVDRVQADVSERADELAAHILRARGQNIQVDDPLILKQ